MPGTNFVPGSVKTLVASVSTPSGRLCVAPFVSVSPIRERAACDVRDATALLQALNADDLAERLEDGRHPGITLEEGDDFDVMQAVRQLGDIQAGGVDAAAGDTGVGLEPRLGRCCTFRN